MSPFPLIAILLTLLAGLALLSGLFIAWKMFIPTRGRRITSYPHPTKALLVLDIQVSGTVKAVVAPLPAETPFGRMIAAVNRLIECFDSAGLEVAYVRQVFTSSIISRLHGGRILAGSLEPRICRWVKVVNGNDFAKNRTDAFSNQQLERLLIDRQVEELFLVGLDAAFCVYYTALGALNRGYRVTVVTDAVMTGRDMTRVLKRYRDKGIAVINSRDVVASLSHTATDTHRQELP
jgi:nicotinamidase-related amidase